MRQLGGWVFLPIVSRSLIVSLYFFRNRWQDNWILLYVVPREYWYRWVYDGENRWLRLHPGWHLFLGRSFWLVRNHSVMVTATIFYKNLGIYFLTYILKYHRYTFIIPGFFVLKVFEISKSRRYSEFPDFLIWSKMKNLDLESPWSGLETIDLFNKLL